MIKSQKGITLVSLIITLVLMLILASTAVTMSLDRFEINSLRKMFNDIELLQDKVSNYYLKYNALPVLRNGTNTPVKYTYTTLDFNKNSADNDTYYILDLEAMEGISLNYGEDGFKNPNTTDDVYIINEASHTVYYVKGMELEGVIHHTLTNITGIAEDIIPPTTPQIKVISGTQNANGLYTSEVELELVPGREDGNVAKQTEYSLDNGATWKNITELNNNIYKIATTGAHSVKLRSFDKNDNRSEEVSLDLNVEIRVRKTFTANSTNKSWLELQKSYAGTAGQFKIYGNSIQNGTPSPDNPVEVESVGDLVTDTTDVNYGKYKIPVKVSGKNLFSYSAETVENDTYKITVNQDKSLTLDNYLEGLKYFNISSMGIDIIGGKEYNITLGLSKEFCTKVVFAIRFYDENNQLIVNVNTSNATVNKFEAPSNFTRCDAYITVGSNMQEIEGLNLYPMVYEENLENVEYEPYVEPQTFNIYLDEPLRKVGDVADYIDFTNGEVVRNIYVSEDITEDMSYQTIYWKGETVVRFGFRNESAPKAKLNTHNILSEFLPGTTGNASEWKNDYESIFVHPDTGKNFYFSFTKERLGITDTDTDEQIIQKGFDYLNAITKRKVYYALETPSEPEKIELPELKTFNEYTKIEVLTEVPPSEIYAQYEGYEFQ